MSIYLSNFAWSYKKFTFYCDSTTYSAVVKVSKPVVPLLKSEFVGELFSGSYIVEPAKSGGAMAPLAPLLTTALDNGILIL